jgi:hypothetical protein
MGETALAHPLVDAYLNLFDAEAAILPCNGHASCASR